MNPAQARVINPILSTHAQGYRNAQMISHIIFPFAPIPQRGARVIKFGKDAFRKLNTRRAPGSGTKRVQYGYASDPVALVQDSLEATVAHEIMDEASKVPGLDLAKISINMVLDVIALGREVETAEMIRNPANYGPNNKMAMVGAGKWSDPASDPAKDVKEAREQVRRRIGRYPNLFTISPAVFNALSEHPKILEKFKYTSSDSITVEMLAKYFNIEKVVVGSAVYLPENAGDDEDAIDVWGNDAQLAYVPAGGNYMEPSFGYTYRLKGSPVVEAPYSERNVKSWVYPVTEDWAPVMAGADAGFLFQNPT